MDEFVVKDSGARVEYASGMVRDVQDDKPLWRLIRSGPMLKRWVIHLTKGALKYGRDNWTLACSQEEYERFQDSAARHFEQWLAGERDEDHAAAVYFNINAAEYVRDRLNAAEYDNVEWDDEGALEAAWRPAMRIPSPSEVIGTPDTITPHSQSQKVPDRLVTV